LQIIFITTFVSISYEKTLKKQKLTKNMYFLVVRTILYICVISFVVILNYVLIFIV